MGRKEALEVWFLGQYLLQNIVCGENKQRLSELAKSFSNATTDEDITAS